MSPSQPTAPLSKSTNKPLMDFIAGRIKNMASVRDLEILKQELQLRERQLAEERLGPGTRATSGGGSQVCAKVEDVESKKMNNWKWAGKKEEHAREHLVSNKWLGKKEEPEGGYARQHRVSMRSNRVQQSRIGGGAGDIKKSRNRNRGRRRKRAETPGSTQTEAKMGQFLAPLLRDDAMMVKMNEAHGLQREVNRRLRDIEMDCDRRA